MNRSTNRQVSIGQFRDIFQHFNNGFLQLVMLFLAALDQLSGGGGHVVKGRSHGTQLILTQYLGLSVVVTLFNLGHGRHNGTNLAGNTTGYKKTDQENNSRSNQGYQNR